MPMRNATTTTINQAAGWCAVSSVTTTIATVTSASTDARPKPRPASRETSNEPWYTLIAAVIPRAPTTLAAITEPTAAAHPPTVSCVGEPAAAITVTATMTSSRWQERFVTSLNSACRCTTPNTTTDATMRAATRY